jgi:FkbM family methyltransferase
MSFLKNIWLKNFLSLIPFPYRTPNGFKVKCRKRYEIKMLDGVFQNDCYLLKKITFPVKTVIDLGANIGTFSLACADRFPLITKIIAVEAAGKTFGRLKENISDNSLKAKITPLHAAITNHIGKVTFYRAKAHYGSSLISGKVYKCQEQEEVDATTLDQLMKDHALTEVDILKVDVEGSEVEMLKNGLNVLAVTKFIMIETHENYSHFDQVKEILDPLGFIYSYPLGNVKEGIGDFIFSREPVLI